MNRLRIAFAAAVLLATLAPGLAAQDPRGKSFIIERIIVKVNGEILTQSELEKLQIEQLQDQKRSTAPIDLSTDPALIKALQEITPSLLVDAVDDLLLVQHGRSIGVKFTDENFKFALDNVKKANKLDDKQFAVALKETGMTLEQLRENFERTYIRREVEGREIMRNMRLTEEELRQYFKAHPDQFMSPATITLREILIAVPTETVGGQATVNVAKDDEAKQNLETLRARALKGEDFAALVTEASEAGTKANGGLVGPMLAEDLAPAVAAAIEKLKPGEITPALRLGNGYRIFKVEARTASEVQAFDKVRQQIEQRIYESRLEVETRKFLEKLHEQALIEWKDDGYKKMWEQGRAQRAKG